MLTNKSRKSQKLNFITKETEISESIIKQVNYLQKVIGNKEVESLINKGIINRDSSSPGPELSIIANTKKKEEYEAEQIKKDREELKEEVAQKVLEKKEEADSLLNSTPGTPLYVNVKTNLVYAAIPGRPSSLFYHYTDLVDIGFSYQDIHLKGQAQKIKRGEVIPVIYSFTYEPVEDTLKKEDDKGPEEKIEKEEKVPGEEKAPPTGKKGAEKKKKEEIATTIMNTKKKSKKGS